MSFLVVLIDGKVHTETLENVSIAAKSSYDALRDENLQRFVRIRYEIDDDTCLQHHKTLPDTNCVRSLLYTHLPPNALVKMELGEPCVTTQSLYKWALHCTHLSSILCRIEARFSSCTTRIEATFRYAFWSTFGAME